MPEDKLSVLIETIFDRTGIKVAEKEFRKFNATVSDGGKYVDSFTGKTLKQTEVMARLGKEAKNVHNKTKNMNKELYKTLFFTAEFVRNITKGIKIFNRMFGDLFETYKKVTGGQTELAKSLTHVNAAFEYLKFVIAEALIRAIQPMLPSLIALFEAIADFVDQHPEVVLIAVGAALTAIAALVFKGVIDFAKSMIDLIKMGIKELPIILSKISTYLQNMTNMDLGGLATRLGGISNVLTKLAGIAAITIGVYLATDSIAAPGVNMVNDIASAIAIGFGIKAVFGSVVGGAMAFGIPAIAIVYMDWMVENTRNLSAFAMEANTQMKEMVTDITSKLVQMGGGEAIISQAETNEINERMKSISDSVAVIEASNIIKNPELMEPTKQMFITLLDTTKQAVASVSLYVSEWQTSVPKIYSEVDKVITKLHEIPTEIVTIHRIIEAKGAGGPSGGASFNWGAAAMGALGGAVGAIGAGLLGSRQMGGYIPETGPYLLHAGENVVPAGGAGGGATININNPVVRNDQDISKIADAVSRVLASRMGRRTGVTTEFG